jgi:hypothetical protein
MHGRTQLGHQCWGGRGCGDQLWCWTLRLPCPWFAPCHTGRRWCRHPQMRWWPGCPGWDAGGPQEARPAAEPQGLAGVVVQPRLDALVAELNPLVPRGGMPEARAALFPPSREDGLAIRMVDSDGCFGEDDCAVLVRKRSQANEGIVWGKEGMMCPNIAARGREGIKARVALATKHSGLPFATRTLTGGALGL